MSIRCKRSIIALGTWAVLVLAGCTTPSVPIPPPEPEKMVFSVDVDAGEARFSYQPTPTYAFATVYVFNRDSGEGVITTARENGSVGPSAPFPGASGDHIVVSFELESQLASTCVVLEDGQSSSGLECDL